MKLIEAAENISRDKVKHKEKSGGRIQLAA